MARLIGEKPTGAAEEYVYNFVMKVLPDYIYALFTPTFHEGYELNSECDCILFIPHMGVFVMDIIGGSGFEVRDGVAYIRYTDGHFKRMSPDASRENRYAIINYLKDKFHVSPFVYEMYCLPFYPNGKDFRDRLAEYVENEYVIFGEDLQDYLDLITKLQIGRAHIEKRYKSFGVEKEDLNDVMAHNIYMYWETGMDEPKRPQTPPKVFLSYNQMNGAVAFEIKEDLERRMIYVWRAPEDVKLGGYYKDEETDAIKSCDAFVILLSSSAQESLEVKYEFEEALKADKMIIPIWVEDCEPNEYYQNALTHYQYRIMTKIDPMVMNEIERTIKQAAE